MILLLDCIMPRLNTILAIPYDPYRIFNSSSSPAGLYARKKWLGQEKERSWQNDFNNTVAVLLEGQSTDGGWHGSFITTVRRLFGLHLTVREPNEQVRRGLDWIFRRTLHTDGPEVMDKLSTLTGEDLRNLPFVPGDPHLLALAMVLFLSTIFGQGDASDVVSRYAELSQKILAGRYGSGKGVSNLLRAFVVHPLYANDPATVRMVERLSELQDDQGMWPDRRAFYQTVNALAHLRLPQADRQLEHAFRLLYETQGPDGTWGKSEQELNTFLVVHALRNKGVL
jgi:hypothetical protein